MRFSSIRLIYCITYSINKKGNKCFKYAVTVALNYEEIKKDPQKIIKIKPFISKYII